MHQICGAPNLWWFIWMVQVRGAISHDEISNSSQASFIPMVFNCLRCCRGSSKSILSYHLYNLKNVKNTHGGVLLSVNLQNSACNFTKTNTPLWMLFTFFKLYKCCQITQSVSNRVNLQVNRCKTIPEAGKLAEDN